MIVEQAYLELYPNQKLGKYEFSINYSGRFSGYNANVQMRSNHIIFNLSKNWKKINDDVKIGLVQSLFNKIFSTKKNTQNIDLYEIFLKKIHIAVPKTKTDSVLSESFDRVNEKYFYGLIEKPNLTWGRLSKRKLGSYDYGTDTISISTIFTDQLQLLDYIIYHEMLHKKHKFSTKNGKSYHHTKDFKKAERKFENHQEIEIKIDKLIKKKSFKYDNFQF